MGIPTTHKVTATALAAVLLAAPAALAQPASPPPAAVPEVIANTLAEAGPTRMSQVIGARVYNDAGERIGEVDDIVLARPTALGAGGPVAVIEVGGFLGIGTRAVAVPLGELRWNAERERIVLPGVTKEALAARPAFDHRSLRQR